MKLWFSNSLLLLAVLQVGSGLLLAGFLLADNNTRALLLPQVVRLATCAVFAIIGIVLLRFDRSPSSRHLAASFLLIAVSYSTPLLRVAIAGASPWLASYAQLLLNSSIEVFLSYQTWSFFQTYFTRKPMWMIRAVTGLSYLSLAIGVFLVIVNLLPSSLHGVLLQRFVPGAQGSYFQLSAYSPLLPLFPAIIAMFFYTSGVELRKVAVLVLGIGFTIPATIIILASAVVPGFMEFVTQPLPSAFFISFINLLLMLSPLTITYAIIVFSRESYEGDLSNMVLYQISIALIYSFMVVPCIGIAWYLYSMRELQLSSLFDDRRVYLLLLCIAGLAFMYTRRLELVNGIATFFYRKPYSVSEAYARISDGSHNVSNAPALLQDAITVIEETLSPVSIAGYLHDPHKEALIPLSGNAGPIELDDAHYSSLQLSSTSPVAGSVLFDIQALNPGKAVLLIRNAGGEFSACVLLGEKKNGDAYDQEDRKFLVMVQEILEIVFANLVKEVNDPAHDFLIPFEAARECTTCQALYTPQQKTCPACSARLSLASIPYLLNKKYHLVSKLGMGEFGQVYLGTDNTLARKVAIKSLPATASKIDQEFLKKEALLMAQVSHPNLAIVYGIEFWHNRPLLVVEYLPGGTLETYLEAGNLDIDRGAVIKNLCNAVAYAHEEGVLHLDIKPSNIGFSKQKDIKLLDFGTAHLVKSITAQSDATGSLELTMEQARRTSVSRTLLGTPIYMSPEAHSGAAPNPSFDLWSLTVVIIELLTGIHPFIRNNWGETHRSIIKGAAILPDWVSPELKKLVTEKMLNADLRRRPQSAKELGEIFQQEWKLS